MTESRINDQGPRSRGGVAPQPLFAVAAVLLGEEDLAHAALNHGLKYIVFRGDSRLAEKLLDIAERSGAKVEIVAEDERVQKPN